MHSTWKFYIANSTDLTKVADITKQSRNKKFQLSLNKAGSFDWELPLSTEWVDDLDPVRNCIVCRKNNVTVWSGPIWTKKEDFAADKITLSAVGWYQILAKRILIDTLLAEDKKRGAIIFDLLDAANDQFPTWITEGTNTDTASVDVTRSYEKYAVISSEIDQLTNEESGPDFSIDPDTREMNITAWDDFEVRDNVVVAYNTKPRNAVGFSRNFDADTMKNQIHVTGQSVQGYADDEDSQTYHDQLFQEVVAVSDTNDASLLGAIASAEIVTNSYPRITYEITPKKTSADNAISFFEDFNLGDQIKIAAERHDIVIAPHSVRAFSVGLDIDMNGNEQMSSLGVTYQGA
jgi:hypothetical protein